jgi:acylphosphatase
MDVIRRRAVVHGRVQGVGFRVSTRAQARRLGLAGSARNLPDGSVEVEVEGPAVAVADLLAWLESGPRLARVEAVAVSAIDPTGDTGFALH